MDGLRRARNELEAEAKETNGPSKCFALPSRVLFCRVEVFEAPVTLGLLCKVKSTYGGTLMSERSRCPHVIFRWSFACSVLMGLT